MHFKITSLYYTKQNSNKISIRRKITRKLYSVHISNAAYTLETNFILRNYASSNGKSLNGIHRELLPNLSGLIYLILSISTSTACCERGFVKLFNMTGEALIKSLPIHIYCMCS